MINNTLNSHLCDSGRFLQMLEERGALLYGNACEPSSVKPPSFMYLEEEEMRAQCHVCALHNTVHCIEYPSHFSWMTEGSLRFLRCCTQNWQTELSIIWNVILLYQNLKAKTHIYFHSYSASKGTFIMAWSPWCWMYKLPFRWHLPAEFHERENFHRIRRHENL